MAGILRLLYRHIVAEVYSSLSQGLRRYVKTWCDNRTSLLSSSTSVSKRLLEATGKGELSWTMADPDVYVADDTKLEISYVLVKPSSLGLSKGYLTLVGTPKEPPVTGSSFQGLKLTLPWSNETYRLWDLVSQPSSVTNDQCGLLAAVLRQPDMVEKVNTDG